MAIWRSVLTLAAKRSAMQVKFLQPNTTGLEAAPAAEWQIPARREGLYREEAGGLCRLQGWGSDFGRDVGILKRRTRHTCDSRSMWGLSLNGYGNGPCTLFR